ncbi:VOC family protein [Mycolicibacterium pulveris]|uniref:Glyoxalase n=2 Tax=Mycolicibacterium pulveris TaxID=36813 RepID=A0A7I7UPB9_MYCPV|nr:VOC family protein [Mycolicibacterium pulveris]BBY83197.1 glyoxalase [Mycolicibacterium pulveris]
MIVRMHLFEQPWPDGEFRFFQLGHVVDDILEAATGWARTFGVGPFHVLPAVDQEADYRGETRTVRIQVAVAQAGPVQIELIQQHCQTPSIYSEWSRGATSSFHQIATVTRDYDAKTADFASLGYPVAAQSVGGGFRVAYIDTVADFGFYTEVVEAPPAFLDQVRRISETCARWDGTDPVRIMTRDGYRVPEDSRGHPRTLKS